MHLNAVYDVLEEKYVDILTQPRALYDDLYSTLYDMIDGGEDCSMNTKGDYLTPEVTCSNPTLAIRLTFQPMNNIIFLFRCLLAQLVEQRTENRRVLGSISRLGIFLIVIKGMHSG